MIFIGYYVLIKHLLVRTFLNIDHCQVGFDIDPISKLNLKMIASVIYHAFREFIISSWLPKYVLHNEDSLRHLFFGTQLSNALEQYVY